MCVPYFGIKVHKYVQYFRIKLFRFVKYFSTIHTFVQCLSTVQRFLHYFITYST